MCDLLRKHTEIVCGGEAFKSRRLRLRPYRITNAGRALGLSVFTKPYMGEPSYQKFLDARIHLFVQIFCSRNQYVEQFLDTYFAQSGELAAGFKLMADQSRRFLEIRRYIINNNVKVIHIERLNYLKVWVSMLLAFKRGKFHSRNAGLESIKVRVPVKGLMSRLDRISEDNKYWKRSFSDYENYYHFSYESFVLNPSLHLNSIFDFLGIEPQKLESDLKKINSNDLSILIENYDEVLSALEGSQYEKFICTPNSTQKE